MSKLVAIAPRRLVFEDAGRFVVYERSHLEKSSEVKKAWQRTFFEELTADLVPVVTGPRLYYLVGRSPFAEVQWRADQHPADQVPLALQHLASEVCSGPPGKRNGAARPQRRGKHPL